MNSNMMQYHGNWMLRKGSLWQLEIPGHSSLIPRSETRLGTWSENETLRLSAYSANIPSASASFVTPPSLAGEGWTFGRSVLR